MWYDLYKKDQTSRYDASIDHKAQLQKMVKEAKKSGSKKPELDKLKLYGEDKTCALDARINVNKDTTPMVNL